MDTCIYMSRKHFGNKHGGECERKIGETLV